MKNIFKEYKLEIIGIIVSLLGYILVTEIGYTPEWLEIPFGVGVIFFIGLAGYNYVRR